MLLSTGAAFHRLHTCTPARNTCAVFVLQRRAFLYRSSPSPSYNVIGISSANRLIAFIRIAAVHDCGIDENNAALIAAAPEMLEALITFRDDISAEAEEESGIYIDDIIEKATGKTWVEIKELIK